MKGEDLKKLLETNPYLSTVDIRYTIAYLLKRRLINPSVLIDEYTNILNEERDKYKCHFVEADTCIYLMTNGDEEQKEFGKKRAMYNAQFNTSFPSNYKLTEEELEESRNWFINFYGFNPEDD